jgi:HlyD family secretion protein
MDKKFKNTSPWVVGLMAAGVLAIGSSTYFFLGRTPPKLNIEQLTVPVKSQTLKLRITASGTVVPVQSVNLSPKAAGRLVQLYVEQGDRVQEGQKIAQMDNRDIQAQLNGAKANYEQAKARLAEAQRGSRKEEIAQARARLDQAEARLQEARTGRPEEIDQAQARLNQAKARLEQAVSSAPEQIAQAQAQVNAASSRVKLAQERFKSYEFLARQGAIQQDKLNEVSSENTTALANLQEAQRRLEQQKSSTSRDIDREKAAVTEAEQALKQIQKGKRPEEIDQLEGAVAEARSALEQLQNGTRPEQIAQFEAAAEASKAQMQAAQVQMEDTIIRAPFSGIVTQKYANVGAFVTPTTSASSTNSATSTSIVALAKDMEIKAKIPEVNIGQIKPGQQVEIVADSYPDKVFTGRVRLVAPEAVVEQSVTSFEVRVAIETGRNELRSGMNVNVTFLGKELPNALLVPTVAIVTEGGKTGVLTPDEKNQPKFHPVKIGSSIEDQTQILEGIKEGDRVFIELPKDRKFNSNDSQTRAVKTDARAAGVRTKP